MVVAFILVTANKGQELSLVEYFKGIDSVENAWSVYGSYDIIVKLSAPSLEEMNNLLLNKIRANPNIQNTTTLIKL